MNLLRISLSSVLIAMMLVISATPAFANGVGGDLQNLADLTGSANVGEFISGVIYGNTSNPSGNGNGVLPSLSPGPWRCGNPLDCAGPTIAGGSMGDFIAPITSDGMASPDFANGKSAGPDFSN